MTKVQLVIAHASSISCARTLLRGTVRWQARGYDVRSDAAKEFANHFSGSDMLSFDVVIVTRNRPEALALSIPLILEQSRKPEKLIIIDSSDDPAVAAKSVEKAARGWNRPVILEHSGPGITRQRNLGLAHVTAEIVIFPDDDSLFHPGAAEGIMQAYERDRSGQVAGVCAAVSLEPPHGILSAAEYEMTSSHRRESRLKPYVNSLERHYNAINPIMWLGRLLMARFEAPSWLAAENCVPVEYMTGCRMSFRTAAIRSELFDENLSAYAVGEDRDASFAAMHHGCLVGARDALIYHHKFPHGRGDPFMLGVMQLLNQVYVVLKHGYKAGLSAAEMSKLRRLIRQFSCIKVLTSLPSARKQEGRDRVRGVLAARGGINKLLQTPYEHLAYVYKEIEAGIASQHSN